MRFSIIVPVYNVEQYLARCLDSIIQQSFGDFEVICINDGSTDGSLEILNSYEEKDSRIAVKSVRNGGLSAARNLGMEMATGEYVMFVDSDDWIVEGTLDRLDKIADCPGYDMVAFNVIHYFEQGGEYIPNASPEECTFESGWQYYESCAGIPWFGIVCARLFRNAFIKENGLRFDEDIAHCEDLMFTINACYLAGRVKVVPDPLYVYRRKRPGSILSTDSESRYHHMLAFANRIGAEYIPKQDIGKGVLYRTISSYYRNCYLWCPESVRGYVRKNIDWKLFRVASSCSARNMAMYLALRFAPWLALPVLSGISNRKATI